MSLDFELYEGKKYSDLVKDIVKNHKSKQSQIKVLTDQLVDMVSEPGDAVMVVPLIKGYLDSDIKNDEALVKLAQILQKANQTTETGSDLFSEKDLEMLFSDIQKSTIPSEEEIKKLPSIDASKS
jgi:hypothetical protein